MFPSSGYFRGINCSFYVNGLCERPNCHFRHSRVEEKPKSESGPNYSTSVKPYQPGTVQLFSSTLLQASSYGQKDAASYSTSAQIEAASSLEAHKASASKETQGTSASPCPIPSFSESPQILPEPDELPLQIESLPKISGLPKPKAKGPGSSDLPSYIPTPKRVQLIVKGTVPSYNPTPKHAEKDSKKNSSNTVEYDPVKNFSFRDKINSDTEDDDHTDSKDVLISESQKNNARSLRAEVVAPASSNDNGNNDRGEQKERNGDESDLTDSDEDVSQKYDEKNDDDGEKLPQYADLLTPSSYFTIKLNSSVDRKLSSDSDVNSSAKSGDVLQHKSSVDNNKSYKRSNSKHMHKSHHYKISNNSQLSSKSSSSSSEEKSRVLQSTSSEKNNISGSSTHHAKIQRSSSHSEVKHSRTDKVINGSSSHSEVKHSRTDKVSNESSSHSEVKHIRTDKVSNESPSHSEVKHFRTDKVSKLALKDGTEKSLFRSSRDNKIQNGSVSKKENKNKSSNLSSSSSSPQKKHKSSSSSSSQKQHKSLLSSSSSKNGSHSRKTDSSEASRKLKSKNVPNGHSVQKKENEVQASDKPSKHKDSDSKLSHSGRTAQNKETVQNDSIVNKRSSSNSSHKSDSHRRSSMNGHSSSNIRQEGREVNERIRNDEKSTIRRHSGDSLIQEVTNNHDRAENNKTDTIRRVSTDNCKFVTERRISNLTANLFGEESGGSESDSDVQIMGVTVKASQPVHTVSESDQEMEEDNSATLYSDDVDLLSDTDTFDECLRIFEETERRLAAKAAKSQKLGINPETAKLREAPKVTETSENLLLSVIRKRMAHKMVNQMARPVKKATFRSRPSPAEVMHNRIVDMQKRALLRAARREGRESELPTELVTSGLPPGNKASSKPNLPGPTVLPSSSSLSEAASSFVFSQKKREAHTPSVKTATKSASAYSGPAWSTNSFYNKKKTEPSTCTDSMAEKKLVTIASTASKTEKRVAHEPTQWMGIKKIYTLDTSIRGLPAFLGFRSLSLHTANTISAPVSSCRSHKENLSTMHELRSTGEDPIINLKRPVIPAEFGTKVPSNIRQRYLNLMIDEYLKFTPEEAAFVKGQEEEQAAYNRASNKNIYLRVAVNAIKRIRTEALESQPSTSKKQCLGLASLSSMASTSHPAQSHEATLGGSLAAKTSYTLHRSGNATRKVPQTFSGKELYEQLQKYILTEQQLRENGYPRPAEDGSNKVRFFKEEEKDKMLKDNERTCRRCGKRFYVDKDGGSISLEQCVYHYANAYKRKVAGSLDSRYGCCSERIGTKGCQVAKSHVHERNKTDVLTGYMKTLPASPSSEKNYGVYSLDCEMVYTKAGIELARVTVVGDDCSVKYESFVKPDAEIIDYNTRFSGITEKDMHRVTTTLRGVQAVMLSMICDKTILIGHSLESDLLALKLIHSTVVDTAIVFPHRLGPPYKRALRSLMVDHLQKIIQADEEEEDSCIMAWNAHELIHSSVPVDSGHDSKEDAAACMQLMLYKVKTDVKRRV